MTESQIGPKDLQTDMVEKVSGRIDPDSPNIWKDMKSQLSVYADNIASRRCTDFYEIFEYLNTNGDIILGNYGSLCKILDAFDKQSGDIVREYEDKIIRKLTGEEKQRLETWKKDRSEENKSDQPQTLKELEAEMVAELRKLIDTTDQRKWKQIKGRLELEKVENDGCDDVASLFNLLKTKGKIETGNYEYLDKALKNLNEGACKILAKYTDLMGRKIGSSDPGRSPPVQLNTTKRIKDLMNGMRDLEVKKTTQDFYDNHIGESYFMSKTPQERGKALIINVGSVNRPGTDKDRDNLKHLLDSFRFSTVVYNDHDGLSGEEIKKKVKQFAGLSEHKDANATIVCILSHGSEGHIKGTDGSPVNLNGDIFRMFDNSNCPSLQDKPKIFIIQACRGGTDDSGVNKVKDGMPDNSDKKIPTQSDMLKCFPTQAGFVSWRYEVTGSVFISALVSVFEENAKDKDVVAMMSMVNNAVHDVVIECHSENASYKQMSEYTSSLRKPCFFFPGI